MYINLIPFLRIIINLNLKPKENHKKKLYPLYFRLPCLKAHKQYIRALNNKIESGWYINYTQIENKTRS